MSMVDQDSRLSKVEEIVSENIDLFLQKIHNLSDIGPFRKSRRIDPDFKMFEPATAEYYEYRYFERSLECYIRENLINTIIPQMFSLYDIDCLMPDYGNTHYVDFSNESIENVFPFEFIIKIKGTRIGYRYTSPCWDDKELKQTLKKYRIDQVRVIDWSDVNAISSGRISWGISQKLRSLVVNVTAKEFFLLYFSSEEYELVVNSIKNAVAEANKEIGFSTIPSLSLSYLSKFKVEELSTLSHFSFNELAFKETGESHPIKNLLSEEDYHQLDERFVGCKLYKALVGSEKFANSFLTSEYMYQILKAGGQFDYTAVVCGYLKSIEQLLYKMIKVTLEKQKSCNLMIRPAKSDEEAIKNVRIKNPHKKNSWLIPFKEEYETFFDITLGSMIWFVNDNEAGWYLTRNGKNTVRRYLFNFSNEDRNEHFHKDNIDDFDEVERIRNNTLTLMYYLIGGYRLTEDINADASILGIYDDSFDRMYARMAEIPKGRGFYLKFKGKDEIMAIRLFLQERPTYDKNGFLKDSSIRFVKVNQFDVDYNKLTKNITEENELIIDHNNMPESIWLSLGSGKRMQVKW